MLLTWTSPLIAIAMQKSTRIVYPILWRRQIQLCLKHSEESRVPLEPGVIAHRRHGKPLWAEYLTKQPKQNRKQRNQPASTPTAPPRDRRNP